MYISNEQGTNELALLDKLIQVLTRLTQYIGKVVEGDSTTLHPLFSKQIIGGGGIDKRPPSRCLQFNPLPPLPPVAPSALALTASQPLSIFNSSIPPTPPSLPPSKGSVRPPRFKAI